MTTWAVTAKYGEKEIYSVGKYDFSQNPKETFLHQSQQPVPKE